MSSFTNHQDLKPQNLTLNSSTACHMSLNQHSQTITFFSLLLSYLYLLMFIPTTILVNLNMDLAFRHSGHSPLKIHLCNILSCHSFAQKLSMANTSGLLNKGLSSTKPTGCKNLAWSCTSNLISLHELYIPPKWVPKTLDSLQFPLPSKAVAPAFNALLASI